MTTIQQTMTVPAAGMDDPDNGYAATLAACQEARDIMSGKIKAKAYHSVDAMFDELDAEYEAELKAKQSSQG